MMIPFNYIYVTMVWYNPIVNCKNNYVQYIKEL